MFLEVIFTVDFFGQFGVLFPTKTFGHSWSSI